MKRSLFYLSIIILLMSCARRSSPSGGKVDTNPPILISAVPSSETVNFNKKEIKIYFNEYIKLKDIRKHLVVSPPLKYQPTISPLGVPSKKIKIIIKDTLIENTTYTFNFGESIVDNSEGNILTNFKYIFSTGAHIDSLSIEGKIEDAFSKKPDQYVSVLLYPFDEKFNDSTIFKEKPLYIANTLDSITWQISNIKKGKYRLVALKEDNNDFIYQPNNDKIAFLDNVIEVPTEKYFLLKLYKKTLPFKIRNPKEVAKGHLIFGFEGDGNKYKITPIDKTIKQYVFTDFKTDTIHLFYDAKKPLDSLQFKLENDNFSAIKTVKLRAKNNDSLVFKNLLHGTLHINDTICLLANNPIINVDEKQLYITDKDSVSVSFKTHIKHTKLYVIFNQKEAQQYTLNIAPNAITDFYNQKNDSLTYHFRTKKIDYYGSITMDIKGVKNQTIILQLLTDKFVFIEEQYLNKDSKIEFLSLIPGKYNIRVIYDDNKNGKWDTGNYLKKMQPEKVTYFTKEIDVKENWFINETMQLE